MISEGRDQVSLAPGWGTFDLRPERDEIHVAPALGGVVTHFHTLTPLCLCRPHRMAGRVLDTPIWSHQDRTWPGSATTEADA